MDSSFFLGAKTMIDVNSKIRELYFNKKYYYIFNRKIKKQNYWSLKKDPDGKIRDRINNHFFEKKKFIKNNKNLINLIKSLKIKNFCDVGCGPGYLISYFSKKIKVFGIENDLSAINLAKRYGTIYNFDLDQPINLKKKFDLITCYHVIEHLKKPEFFLKNIKKILNKNKYLIVGTPDFDCYMARKYGNKFRLLHDKTHVSLFSKDSLLRFLRDYGFDILSIDFPFEDTQYFKKNSFLAAFKKKKNFSPPFYGNFMTILAKKK